MVLKCYDKISLFKNYNLLILYDYRYYCDFKIVLNICIQYINGVSVFGTHIRIRTPYIQLDKLYMIDEPMRLITITLFIINFMNNLI